MKGNFRKNDQQEGKGGPNKKKDEKPAWNWILPLIALAILASLVFAGRLGKGNKTTATTITIPYSQFRLWVQEGRVSRITFNNDRIKGEYSPAVEPSSATGESTQPKTFITYLPPVPDDTLLPLLAQKGVVVETVQQSSTSWWMVALNVLPFLLLIGLGFLFLKRLPGQTEGASNLLKSHARSYESDLQRVTFEDVAGAAGAKRELLEIIDFLRLPQRFLDLGASVPKGVLLVGPPGTGKTLLARAVAGEADVPFYSISGSDFMEMYVGVGASRVRDLFNQARQNPPAIVFIDELDSVGRRRGVGMGGGNDEREQTLNQLLAVMDGFEINDSVIVLAATNRPDILDAALLRPGRFDRQIVVDAPTVTERLEILQVHARNKPLADDVDLEQIARGTPGFSGADLANLLNESALLAVRDGKRQINFEEISNAMDKVILGIERELVLTEEDRRLLAYHEAGHAVVAVVLPHTDPVHKVTIIPRGRAMGVTQQLPEGDRYLYHRDYLLDRMAVMMGGRAAEELAMQAVTSGAADDLKQATRLARKMVLELGMSDSLGHVALHEESQSFLGEEWGGGRDYSERTAQRVDEEISRIVEEAYARAGQVLQDHRSGLDRVVAALIDKEQIFGDEVMRLLSDEADGGNPA